MQIGSNSQLIYLLKCLGLNLHEFMIETINSKRTQSLHIIL